MFNLLKFILNSIILNIHANPSFSIIHNEVHFHVEEVQHSNQSFLTIDLQNLFQCMNGNIIQQNPELFSDIKIAYIPGFFISTLFIFPKINNEEMLKKAKFFFIIQKERLDQASIVLKDIWDKEKTSLTTQREKEMTILDEQYNTEEEIINQTYNNKCKFAELIIDQQQKIKSLIEIEKKKIEKINNLNERYDARKIDIDKQHQDNIDECDIVNNKNKELLNAERKKLESNENSLTDKFIDFIKKTILEDEKCKEILNFISNEINAKQTQHIDCFGCF